jgi:hypothetical protein
MNSRRRVNSNVRHLYRMATLTLEQRRERLVLWWAPVLLLLSLTYLIWAMWHDPISLFYLISWIVIGLGYGISIFFQLRQRPSPWSYIAFFVFGGISSLLAGRDLSWRHTFQGMSILIICVCMLALGWVILCRILLSSDRDVEQIVGPERR